MTVFTFGDSHGSIGWNYVTKVYHGPLLCYTVGTKKLEVVNLAVHGVKEGDAVIFCFGEIDCRCHIIKHITEERSYKDIINDIVEGYFKTIKLNEENLGKKIDVYVFNVVPPTNKDSILHNNEEYPILGTAEERKSYTTYFNQKLKEFCEIYGYGFIDVYDKYTDENGMLDRELSDGNIHIKNGKYLDEVVLKILKNDK